MPSTPVRQDVHGYLQESRRTVLRCADGLGDYRLRHPMTPTGTSILGVIKHLVGIEAGYLGACIGHPFTEPLPWLDRIAAEPNKDMWATADESRDYIVELYQQVCVHSDIVLSTVELDSVVSVPWWPVELQRTTVAGLLARVLKETAMHAGQMQILRELTDGEAGSDRADAGDAEWCQGYTDRLKQVAMRFRS